MTLEAEPVKTKKKFSILRLITVFLIVLVAANVITFASVAFKGCGSFLFVPSIYITIRTQIFGYLVNGAFSFEGVLELTANDILSMIVAVLGLLVLSLLSMILITISLIPSLLSLLVLFRYAKKEATHKKPYVFLLIFGLLIFFTNACAAFMSLPFDPILSVVIIALALISGLLLIIGSIIQLKKIRKIEKAKKGDEITDLAVSEVK